MGLSTVAGEAVGDWWVAVRSEQTRPFRCAGAHRTTELGVHRNPAFINFRANTPRGDDPPVSAELDRPSCSGSRRPFEKHAIKPLDLQPYDETSGLDHLRKERGLIRDLAIERRVHLEQLATRLIARQTRDI